MEGVSVVGGGGGGIGILIGEDFLILEQTEECGERVVLNFINRHQSVNCKCGILMHPERRK